MFHPGSPVHDAESLLVSARFRSDPSAPPCCMPRLCTCHARTVPSHQMDDSYTNWSDDDDDADQRVEAEDEREIERTAEGFKEHGSHDDAEEEEEEESLVGSTVEGFEEGSGSDVVDGGEEVSSGEVEEDSRDEDGAPDDGIGSYEPDGSVLTFQARLIGGDSAATNVGPACEHCDASGVSFEVLSFDEFVEFLSDEVFRSMCIFRKDWSLSTPVFNPPLQLRGEHSWRRALAAWSLNAAGHGLIHIDLTRAAASPDVDDFASIQHGSDSRHSNAESAKAAQRLNNLLALHDECADRVVPEVRTARRR